MKFFIVFLCLMSAIFANSFENKKIIKLNTKDELNIINLNQNINYEKLSNITTIALIPSYEKEYNFYFSNLKINAYKMAKDTLIALNRIINETNNFILLSQKENQNYINSQNIIHPHKNFINASDFLEFNRFKKADFIILIDLKNTKATQRNFVLFSNFDVLVDIEYKIYNAKSNKLKDHKILQIQSQFSSIHKQRSYQELAQNIASAIYNDLQNSI